MHSITFTEIQLRQRLTRPCRFTGNFHNPSDANHGKQTACIFRLLLAQIFRTHIPRPQILKKLCSIIIDCRFNCWDSIITITNSTATPKTRPTDSLNNPAITNITKETANRIHSTIVATNGARFPRLSRHNVTNSTEWFFLIIIARRKRRNKQNNDQSRQ